MVKLFAALVALAACATSAYAEVNTVRLSKQYGLSYLAFMIIEDKKLIEKKAAETGLPNVQAVWTTLGNSGAQIDAVIAGQLDIIGPGVPTLGTIWDKTVGTPQEVKALGAFNSMPYVLVTNNPKVKSIEDFTSSDKIAVPVLKLSGHAVMLQMAAAQRWGFKNYDKLDAFTISRAHPDAATALMSGGTEITAHFASSPYHYYELAKPGLRRVLKSYDVAGGKHTNGVILTSKKFHDANPKLTAAVMAAFNEAHEYIRNNPRDCAETYLRMTGEKGASVDDIEKMVADPDVDYTIVPSKVGMIIDFMHQVGRIKKKPNSWKDLFFEEAHSLNGS